jgi:hypothetical protein
MVSELGTTGIFSPFTNWKWVMHRVVMKPVTGYDDAGTAGGRSRLFLANFAKPRCA